MHAGHINLQQHLHRAPGARTGSPWRSWSRTTPGAAVELRAALRPGFRSALRPHTAGVRGGDLGLPSAAGPRRWDPAGGPYAEPDPAATAHPAVGRAGVR